MLTGGPQAGICGNISSGQTRPAQLNVDKTSLGESVLQAD